MDPTFGGQELLETLSQASRTSKGSRGSSNSTLTSTHTNPVEDAYRRIGQGLSQRATGVGDGGSAMSARSHGSTGRPVARLGQHSRTSFQRFQKPIKKPFNPHNLLGVGGGGSNSSASGSNGGAGHHHPHHQGGPNQKIPKLGRFDDVDQQQQNGGTSGIGSNLNRPNQRILKKITLTAKETFYKLRRQQKAGYQTKYANQAQQQQQQQQLSAGGSALSTSNTSSGHTSATSSMTMSGGQLLDQHQYGRLTEQQLLQQQQQSANSLPRNNGSYNDPSALSSSSQRYAFSEMAQQQQLSGSVGSGSQPHNAQHQQQQQPQQQQNGGPPPKGLLSAVLEGGSESTFESESVHSLPTINSNKTGMSAMSKASSVRTSQSGQYHQYPGPGGSSSNNPVQPLLHFAQPRGRCLTVPGEPVGNEGLDNAEGNMILHQNDILVVPGNTQATKVRNSTNTAITNTSKGLEFHVQSLLGQGTFAQVYCCWESVSKRHVALKVIKNKPAFTKQAAIEIEVFQALAAKRNTNDDISAPIGGNGKQEQGTTTSSETAGVGGSTPNSPHMVHLLSSFMYKSHLCLVFECLGLNLYEVLKRRQFRGLPLRMVQTLARQALEGVKELAGKTIVHCDLKPENILLVGEEVEKDVIGAGEGKQPQQDDRDAMSTTGSVVSLTSVTSTGSKRSKIPQTIKLIDFGSACFEGYSAHTYIQSRFYRSPEVLMGLPYDSAIDIWSLGCVAAELFLGLPILPGVHEHDQCGRIAEMIGEIPDWMLEQGSKASKYYVKYLPQNTNSSNSQHSGSKDSGSTGNGTNTTGTTDPVKNYSTGSNESHRPVIPQWRLKSQEEYITSLTPNEVRKKGGMAKLEKQPANRYFKRTKLSDIIMLHGQQCQGTEKEMLGMFVHFLYGMLDPDPWKRWTAYQASQHPFITGQSSQLRQKTADTKLDYNEENQANKDFDVYWVPPWDPGICRRKLLNVQRMREKQNAQRRGYSQPRSSAGMEGHDNVEMRSASRSNQKSPSMNSVGSRGQPMVVADSPSVGHMSVDGKSSPPSQIASRLALHAKKNRLQAGISAASMPKGAAASSLSGIGGSGLHAVLGTEYPAKNDNFTIAPANTNQRQFAGPQSYTGFGGENNPSDADFTYALQRPGNVPAHASDAATGASMGSYVGGASVSSGQNALHQHQQQQQQQQQYGRAPQNSQPMQSPMYPGQNQAANVSSLPNTAGYSNQAPSRMGGVSYQGGGYGNNGDQQSGIQYLAAQQQLQKQRARGETGSHQQQTDPMQNQMNPAHQQQLMQLQMQQQQEQMAAMQKQHEQQMAALQQQQQLAFQQQQQQFLSQQQYGGQQQQQQQQAGNGYYYVTSADGTPMLMQQQQQPGSGSMGLIPPGSYDGSAAGGSQSQYMLPPQQQHGQQQRTPSFDDGGGGNGGSRSVRDNRSRAQKSRQGRQGGGGSGSYRGGNAGGMSM